MSGRQPPPGQAAGAQAPMVPPPSGAAGSPFAGYAPNSQALGGAAAEQGRMETLKVVLLVGGLMFTVSAAVVALLLVVLLGGLGTGVIDSPVAVAPAPETEDEDVVVPDIKAPTPKPSGRPKPVEVAPEPAPTRDPLVPNLKPASISIPAEKQIAFNGIQAQCPRYGTNYRAKFVRLVANVSLPDDEDCNITFQGSEPARATLRGGQSKSCTFNPTNCVLK